MCCRTDGMTEKLFSWNGKKVLITGVNGFIGVHLAKELLHRGAFVDGTTRQLKQTSYLHVAGLEKKITLFACDVANKEDVHALLEKGRYDVVFHLASQSDTWKSINSPYETMRTNVVGTLNILESVRILEQKPRVILAGTVRAFYDQSSEDAGEGLHPYDASKMSMESIALSYFNAYSIFGAVAKNTNIYGENDLNFSRLIPLIMKQVFVEKKIMLKGNGKLARDFMHVSDAVSGLLTLAERVGEKDISGHTFTFATGMNTSIQRVCDLIISNHGEKLPVVFDDHHSLVERNQPVLSVERTQRLLGWKTRVSLAQGLEKTMNWYHDYFTEGHS